MGAALEGDRIMRMMIFLVLKAVELGLFIFVPYWVGWFNYEESGYIMCWGMGIVVLLGFTLALLVIGALIGALVEVNWELANDLWKKLRKVIGK